ncbi:MAG: hypothetical protein WA876_14190 [Candidatus Acidiferrales bacterium]
MVEDYKRTVQYKNRTTTMIRLTAPGRIIAPLLALRPNRQRRRQRRNLRISEEPEIPACHIAMSAINVIKLRPTVIFSEADADLFIATLDFVLEEDLTKPK